MSDRAPWLKFYPADWQADPGLRACSPAARGIWMDCLALMHGADPYGHLLLNGAKPSTKMLSGLFNVHHKTLIACMKELQEHGVYSETKDGVIFSRRMVRDHDKALQDKANGKRGGNPTLKPERSSGVNPPDNGGLKAQRPEARGQNNTLSNESVARPRKRLASNETLPESPTQAMAAYAAEHGFVDGNAERVFGAWRDHHISKATSIADFEASFRTWVRNEIKFNRGPSHVASTAEPKLFGFSAQNAAFHERSNRGALAALRNLGGVGQGPDEGPFAGDPVTAIPSGRRLGHS